MFIVQNEERTQYLVANTMWNDWSWTFVEQEATVFQPNAQFGTAGSALVALVHNRGTQSKIPWRTLKWRFLHVEINPVPRFQVTGRLYAE